MTDEVVLISCRFASLNINFGTVGRTFRKEAIQKGILYMNIFPYVIWEMQDQVSGMSVACLPILEEHSLSDRNPLHKPTRTCEWWLCGVWAMVWVCERVTVCARTGLAVAGVQTWLAC